MLMLTAVVMASMLAPAQPVVGPDANAEHTWAIDLAAARAVLAAAPGEFDGAPDAVLTLHLRDGGAQRFAVRRSPIMDPALAARFPEIQTYIAQGLDDPAATARLDLSPHGLHALVRSPEGATLIGPVDPVAPAVMVSRPWEAAAGDWACAVGPEHGAGIVADEGAYQPRGPLPLRTYRCAVACTGEFSIFHSDRAGNPPNVPDAMAAIVTIVNRVNVLTENDISVRLVLVPNNDVLVFLDPATDPYDAASPSLGSNITTLNTRIGLANYDIGHLLTRIPGGVAFLNAVCGNNKGGGISGRPRTFEPDPLAGEVMMHEVGHQFGGNHTFNGNVDRCLNNRAANAAWEPGSGTTVLGYPGNCPVGNDPPGDNIQVFRDIMYHLGNIGEMRAFIAGNGGPCSAQVATGNTAPTITSLPPLTGLAIPASTPFELSVAANDAQGDPLTYSWEQFDLGPQRSLESPDNGTSPLFRVFPPATSPSRLFPRLEAILTGIPTRGEQYATVNGTRKFRVAVRDNRPAGGAVTVSAAVELQVRAAAGPFRVTQPASGDALQPGPALVRWNVAQTNLPPINTATITILYSTDNAATFPYVLAAGTPNDGEASVVLPGVSTGQARIRLVADGNVYTAFSDLFGVGLCEPDLNADGNVDQEDVACLIDTVAGNPGCTAQDPDFNGDGNVDQDDVAALINAVAGGGCP